MVQLFQHIYEASWLWLPFLVLFLVQGLHCSPKVRPILFKNALYYIVAAIGLHLLLPAAHLALRNLLFDITTRVFLFIQVSELLWSCWSMRPALATPGIFVQQKLVAKKEDEDDEDEEDDNEVHIAPQEGLPSYRLLIFYGVSTLFYLGWMVVGIMFAFTLTPGM